MFECPKEEGKHRLATTVPPSFFKDFVDNMDPQEVAELKEEEKPAVVIINDYKKFEQRIINKLIEIGVKREEIIIERVLYTDFNKYGKIGWWDFPDKPPFQLTIKHKRFENQSEARIIINTENEKIKQILLKPIEIGSLEDIAQVSNSYHHEGVYVELDVHLKLID